MASNFVKVGSLQRSFGTEGFLKYKLFSDYKEHVQKAEFLWIMHDDYYVPYRVVELNSSKKMIQLDDVIDVESAAKIHNKALYLQLDDVDLIEDERDFLVNFNLFDKEMLVGEIEEIRTIAGHLYAIINREEKEIMIPIHEELILQIDVDQSLIQMDLPEGILDL